MARTSVQTLTLPVVSRLDRWFEASFRFTRQRPLGAVGAAIIGIMIAAALLAGFVSPYDPLATDYAKMLQAPSSLHWFGTDSFGRDVFTRIIYGSRTALWIGFASSFLGSTLGALIGVYSAYFGGKIDLLLQRFMDLLLSFPLVILALVVVSLLGSGMTNVIFAITVPMVPRCALVVRSSALALREMPFVEAARALGFGPYAHHSPPHDAQCHGALLDYAHSFSRSSDPLGSFAVFPRPGRGGAASRLGSDAARRRRRVC